MQTVLMNPYRRVAAATPFSVDERAIESAWGYNDGSGYNYEDGALYQPVVGSPNWTNMVFSLGIPQGATILTAELIVYARNNLDWSDADDVLAGAEQVDDATVLGSGDYTTRYDDYDTTVTWLPLSLGTVTNGDPIDSGADLTSVIQQIVNRAGWVSGNNIGILTQCAGGGSLGGSWHDHTQSESLRPRLQVTGES